MSARRSAARAALLAISFAARSAAAEEISYLPPGDLAPGSGEGRADEFVYAPGMRFPIEEGPAFANSQVWGHGGYAGPPGSQCDEENYEYPWRDNYCESRQWDMPLCPSGTGHQGQDIRPATCEAGAHWAVAAADGTITQVGSYSVYLTGADGTRYEYLHLSDVQVHVGQDVARGERMGKVSNVFGDTATTIHLHFNLRQNVSDVGSVYLPPYTSLLAAYQALMNAPPEGALEAADCGGIRGWTRDPDAPDEAGAVRLSFEGAPGAGEVFAADLRRDDLCEALGSCAHGFAVGLPLGLLGKGERVVRAHGVDGDGGAEAELEGSPRSFACALALPQGVRRRVIDPQSMAAWRFSDFWDVAGADDAALQALPAGDDLPAGPALVRADDGSAEVWLVDGPERRYVPGPEVAAAWHLDLAAAVALPAAEIAALPEGRPLRPRPFVARGSGPEAWLIDDARALPGDVADDASLAVGDDAAEEDDAGGEAACACRAAGSSGGAGHAGVAALGAAAWIGAARRRRRRERL